MTLRRYYSDFYQAVRLLNSHEDCRAQEGRVRSAFIAVLLLQISKRGSPPDNRLRFLYGETAKALDAHLRAKVLTWPYSLIHLYLTVLADSGDQTPSYYGTIVSLPT